MKTVGGVKRRRGGGCCEGITSLTPTQKNQEEKKSKEEEDTEGEVQHLLHLWRRRILTLPLSLKIPTLLPIPVLPTPSSPPLPPFASFASPPTPPAALSWAPSLDTVLLFSSLLSVLSHYAVVS